MPASSAASTALSLTHFSISGAPLSTNGERSTTTPQPLVPAAVETSRRELFLLAARALADAGAREPDDRLASLAGDLAADDA